MKNRFLFRHFYATAFVFFSLLLLELRFATKVNKWLNGFLQCVCVCVCVIQIVHAADGGFYFYWILVFWAIKNCSLCVTDCDIYVYILLEHIECFLFQIVSFQCIQRTIVVAKVWKTDAIMHCTGEKIWHSWWETHTNENVIRFRNLAFQTNSINPNKIFGWKQS